MINWTYADKAIVSVLTSASAYIANPDMSWRSAVVLTIGCILVWLVPNTQNPAKPPPILSAPITNMERAELEELRSRKAVNYGHNPSV